LQVRTSEEAPVTAELTALEPPAGGWTTDDLDELPEDHRRFELIDGALIVSPSPTNIHQTIAARLVAVLEESCPADYDVTQAVEIRVSKTRSFIPDVLVTTAGAAARSPSKFAPHEVALVVEVVSPTSVTMDRITKADLYAQAGIPFYWRVETLQEIVVHAHRLDADATMYRPTGQFAKTVKLDEPWEIDFPVSRITPRLFGREAH
jgi:Uma2 family endonuclease